MILRPYQEAARQAVYAHLRARDDNPCVVLPTAAGKTPLLAAICRDTVESWGGRVLVLAHVKELLEQAAEKLAATSPGLRLGVYSAGLKKREKDAPVIVAGIQSAYQRACELGRFDLVLVDEAHLIPLAGDGMYRQFLLDAKIVNPDLRVVGFTATPFRLDSGLICTPDGILNEICYEAGVRELIRDGFLCPPISRAGGAAIDLGALKVRAGEFVASEVEERMNQEGPVAAACTEIVAQTRDRKSVLIFASGIKHAAHVAESLGECGGECRIVTSDTSDEDRKALLARFKAGHLKYLCNVNVLTTGFDAPNIDCVVLLRPTLSPGLYYQMVGRGFRLHPDKSDFLVLDFGGNVMRHGPVDKLRLPSSATGGEGEAPAKKCPHCHALVAAGFAVCPHCRHEFPPPQRQAHEPVAANADLLSGIVRTEWLEVRETGYRVHYKRLAPEGSPRSLRVDYCLGDHAFKSEWVCFEHQGYARAKAVEWWSRRSPDPVPDSVERAVAIAENGGLAITSAICVRTISGEPFERIIDWRLGPMPEAIPQDQGFGLDDGLDTVPF